MFSIFSCNVVAIKQLRRRSSAGCSSCSRGLIYVPLVIMTDKLASFGAAKQGVLPSVEHRQQRYLNNRAKNSHQPTRQQECTVRQFKLAGYEQRFLATYGPITSHFRARRHRLLRGDNRREMIQRFQIWREITGIPIAA